MDVLSWATNWVNNGVSVIPIERFSKKPATRLLPKGPDGWPHWEPYKTRLPIQKELNAWFPPKLARSYGVVLTWRGLVVVDCEDRQVFEAFRAMLPPTFTVSSGRGGHLYYILANPPGKPIKLAIRDKGKSLAEVLSGGYVLGPGSRHPSGAYYQVIDNLPIACAPDIHELIPEAFFDVEPEPVTAPSILSGEAPILPPASPAYTVGDLWSIVNNPTSSQSVIQKIRQLDILTLFPWKGLKPTGNGWYLANCPFHDDHNPSLSINRNNGTVSCLAGCTGPRPLDQINLYGKVNNCSNQEAIRELSRLVD